MSKARSKKPDCVTDCYIKFVNRITFFYQTIESTNKKDINLVPFSRNMSGWLNGRFFPHISFNFFMNWAIKPNIHRTNPFFLLYDFSYFQIWKENLLSQMVFRSSFLNCVWQPAFIKKKKNSENETANRNGFSYNEKYVFLCLFWDIAKFIISVESLCCSVAISR